MGVTVLIVLTIIALGHAYYSSTNLHKYTFISKPVHIAYYNNAIVGSLFFLISFILYLFLWVFYTIYLDEKIDLNLISVFKVLLTFYSSKISLTTIWFFTSIISMLVLYFGIIFTDEKLKYKIKSRLKELKISNWKEISEYQIYEETLSNPIDQLISNSAYEKEEKYILFTMKDRKVYVGKVKSDPEIFERFSQGIFNFIIEPKYSGYRDKDSLEVVLTTSYIARNSKIPYEIILDKNEILSAMNANLPELTSFLRNKNQFSDLIYEAWVLGMPILLIDKNNTGFVLKVSEDLNLNGNVAYMFEFLKVQVIYQIIFRDDMTIDSYLDFSVGKDFSILLRIDDVKFIYSINKLEDIWKKDGNLNPEYWLNLLNYRLVKK